MKSRLIASAVVIAVAALAFTSAAYAHTLSETRAQNAAQARANIIVKQEDYTSASILECEKLFPHRTRCFVRFKEGNKVTCKDTWMMYYKAHSEAGESRKVFYKSEKAHAC